MYIVAGCDPDRLKAQQKTGIAELLIKPLRPAGCKAHHRAPT